MTCIFRYSFKNEFVRGAQKEVSYAATTVPEKYAWHPLFRSQSTSFSTLISSVFFFAKN